MTSTNADTSEPLVELSGVTRRFGKVTALDDVSLWLVPGQIGLLGPNGAGKSTLLKLLMGLLAPSHGSGTVLGHPLGSWQLRQRVGFMSEADSLVPGLKGVEYVALAGELYGMPKSQARRRAHEVLTYLDLEEARYRLLEEYSTGMKQRLKLAQALVHDPAFLLLDEPTSGLDPAGRDAMLRLLKRLGRDHGKSMILSTHLLADVENVCEQVVILYDGRVRGQGAVRDLCEARQNRYRLIVIGEAGEYSDALAREGVKPVLGAAGRGKLRVEAPAGWDTRRFFLLAEKHGVDLRSMTRDEEKLDELFYRMVNAS